jgi:hypothetical protein
MSANPDSVVIGIDVGTGGQLPPDWALQMPAVDRVAARPAPGGQKGVLA